MIEPELEWIQKAAAGDHAAFRRLVEKHQSRVRGQLYRLTNFDIARSDDVAQDVFLNLFNRLSSYRARSSFSTWLYRITYNAFIDDQRRIKVPPQARPAILSAAPARTDLQQSLNLALSRLREDERQAVILTAIDGLTHEEAAETIGVPLGTLKTNALRGKENLKQLMISFGWEHAV